MPEPRAFGQFSSPPTEAHDVEIRYISLYWNANSTVHWRDRVIHVDVGAGIWMDNGHWTTTVHEGGEQIARLDSGPSSRAGEFQDGTKILYQQTTEGHGIIQVGEREMTWWRLPHGVDRTGFGPRESRLVASSWRPWQDSFARRKVSYLMRLRELQEDEQLQLAIILAPAIAPGFSSPVTP